MSNPTSRYYTAESGNTGSGPFHTASQSLNGGAAGGSGGATGATGGSAGSVSLAPPAWAARLFGGGDQRQEHNAADDDDMVQQGSLELEGMESLRESSVVVRPSPPPLSDAATTPRFGAAARAAAPSPTQLQQPAGSRRYAAEMATTYRPPPPPPGASPLGEAYRLFGQPTPAAAVDPAAAAEAAWSGYQEEAPPLSQKQLFGEQALPTAPPPPLPPGRFGWFRHPQPAAAPAEALPAAAAADPLPAASWGTSSLSGPTSMPPAGTGLPPPPLFRPPSAASMTRIPSSQQQLLPSEGAAHGAQQVSSRLSVAWVTPQGAHARMHGWLWAAGRLLLLVVPRPDAPVPSGVQREEDGSGGKSSPSKSIDASTFHLDAYAGATSAVEEAAARVGGQSQLGGQRPSRQGTAHCHSRLHAAAVCRWPSAPLVARPAFFTRCLARLPPVQDGGAAPAPPAPAAPAGPRPVWGAGGLLRPPLQPLGLAPEDRRGVHW